MRTVEAVEAFATKLSERIDYDHKHGYDQGHSKHYIGLRKGQLEALRWVLEQIDYTDNGMSFHPVERQRA